MLWQLPCMRTFHSIVPPSIMEFYSELGITRDVASRADLSYYALRSLFSVQYYFDKADTDDTEGTPEISLPGFVYETTENGFHRFRNTAYVPMGFTFDTYISETAWESVATSQRTNLLMRALVLSEEQVERYGSWMQPLESGEKCMTEDDYLEECAERAASACDSFCYDSDGFTASITLDSPNLVFFSVPYDTGWSTTVNGEPVTIEQVDTGFMAVPVDSGESTIVFTYETPGLHAGLWISCGGVILLIGYLLICRKLGIRTNKHAVYCVDYPVSAEETPVQATDDRGTSAESERFDQHQ